MRRKRLSKPEQLQLVMECRTSGLSDYQWCHQQGIGHSTFYNWITRLRKAGYTFPDAQRNNSDVEVLPVKNEVVKLEILPKEMEASTSDEQQNARISSSVIQECHKDPAVEIEMAGTTVRFFNNTNPELLKYTLECLGGVSHAW